MREEIERAGSLHGAIAAFGAQPRTLRQLEEVPEWSEAVLTMASVADPEEPVALETLLSERHFEEKQVAERPSWRSLAAVVGSVVALMAIWRLTPLREVATAEAAIAGPRPSASSGGRPGC